jgi:hypothetical protein
MLNEFIFLIYTNHVMYVLWNVYNHGYSFSQKASLAKHSAAVVLIFQFRQPYEIPCLFRRRQNKQEQRRVGLYRCSKYTPKL